MGWKGQPLSAPYARRHPYDRGPRESADRCLCRKRVPIPVVQAVPARGSRPDGAGWRVELPPEQERDQASLQAPGEPGRENINVPFATQPIALD